MARAWEALSGKTITIEDDRQDYGETRYISFGFLDHRLVVIKNTGIDWIDPDETSDLSAQEWAQKFEIAPVKRGRPVLAIPHQCQFAQSH
eukprot:gene13470-13585_t